jgi:acyl-CoA thioesterase-2
MASAEGEAERDPLARVLDRFALARVGDDLFEAPATSGMRRLFGGLIAAQSSMAAMKTVEIGRLHSVHGYFLRPGRPGSPLRFAVTRVRDGRNFSTRRVLATQGGDAIFELSASFTDHEEGVAHAHEPALGEARSPEALPRPDGLPDWETIRAAEAGELPRPHDAIEVRVLRPEDDRPGAAAPSSRIVWMRTRGRLPEDPRLHAAMLIYASDRTLLRTAARLHGGMKDRLPASLDHAVWLHRPPRFDDWIVYASESPIAENGRAFVLGRMLTPSGDRIASVAQEGLLRRPRPPRSA